MHSYISVVVQTAEQTLFSFKLVLVEKNVLSVCVHVYVCAHGCVFLWMRGVGVHVETRDRHQRSFPVLSALGTETRSPSQGSAGLQLLGAGL